MTASCSLANHWPVRQKPDWISSATKTMPCCSAYALSAGRKPGAGTMKPPSPWMGSMTMAAMLAPPISFSIFDVAHEATSAPEWGPSRKG